jgi:hypothetical protein
MMRGAVDEIDCKCLLSSLEFSKDCVVAANFTWECSHGISISVFGPEQSLL